jgi:hypothetical protein
MPLLIGKILYNTSYGVYSVLPNTPGKNGSQISKFVKRNTTSKPKIPATTIRLPLF